MKKCIKVLLIVFMLSLLGCLNGSPSKPTENTPLPTKTSEGVVLHGCSNRTGGWIENDNVFSVRIRHVWQFHGEKTKSIDCLEPGAKLTLDSISHQDGFYIYTMDGTLVGWLSGSCSKEK